MTITGKVLNASIVEREFTDKQTGVRKTAKISHVLLYSVPDKSGAVEVFNIRSYDSLTLPKIGQDWTTPNIRKYENSGCHVSEVLV